MGGPPTTFTSATSPRGTKRGPSPPSMGTSTRASASTSPEFRRVGYVHGEAVPALDRHRDGRASDGGLDDAEELAAVHAVAGQGVVAGDDVDVEPAQVPLVEDAAGPAH